MADRPAQLDDPVWLARAYEWYGDRRIAADLGVSPKMVRTARKRLGIEGAPVGRRRGVTTEPSVRQRGDLDATEQAIIDRYRAAKQRRVPATTQTLAAALRAAHDADPDTEPNAHDAALIDLAAAAALIHQHRQQLRRAA